jgi:hypothetical protein
MKSWIWCFGVYFLVLIFTILSLSGCGTKIPPQLETYVNKFLTEGEVRGYYAQGQVDDLYYNFTDLGNSEILGDCVQTPFSNTINVNTVYWASLDNTQREILLMHEMGHCVLHRVHNRAFWYIMMPYDTEQSEPKSIMFPIILDETAYLKYRKQYLDELFSYSYL